MSESRFVLFSAQDNRVVISEHMGIDDMTGELLRRGVKQVPVAAGWMREANRSDFYESPEGLVILCMSGKRALSRGKLTALFSLLASQREV